MAGILIYSDKEQYARELLSGARLLAVAAGMPITCVVINNAGMAESLSLSGAKVQHIENEQIVAADTAAIASALKQVVQKMEQTIILLSSDRRGKELAGRLAQALDAGCLTDVTGITFTNGEMQCSRNSLGGAAIATQIITTPVKVIAVTPRTFEAVFEKAQGRINKLEVDIKATLKVIETKPKAEDGIDIEVANVIVAVGQGLAGPEALPEIEALADAVGGVVACSKPVATDRKWLSEDRVIGLSGKKCKPSLAILLGISGQVQFTVGIRDARTIIAVNQDENAYALHMCDYGLVGDLHEFAREFRTLLKK
jgi:electron transfer flavoprotein alpha subunit